MGRTLLIGSETGVWRERLQELGAERSFLSLDPANADFGFPGRLAHFQGGRCVEWRFFGGLTATRAPHVALAGLAALLPRLSADAVIELPPYRVGSLRLQMARLAATMIRPDRIEVDRRCRLDPRGWPAERVEVDLPDPLPASVRSAQRKARWLQVFEQCERHEVDLHGIAVDGLRLGSGIPIPRDNLIKYGFTEPLHGEVAGSSVLMVSDAKVEDVEISRVLDAVHASKAIAVAPRAYDNLICALSRPDGEDFAIGRIVRIRFPEMIAELDAAAVEGTPFATLRVGGLRIDAEGRELGEAKPWEI